MADKSAVVNLGEVKLKDKLEYIEEPIHVLDRKMNTSTKMTFCDGFEK